MRKILNKLSILFVVFILIASPQAICDDIDYEALDVDSEVFTSSSRLEKNITEPDVNSRACVVIDKKTNTILYGKNEKQKKFVWTNKNCTNNAGSNWHSKWN